MTQVTIPIAASGKDGHIGQEGGYNEWPGSGTVYANTGNVNFDIIVRKVRHFDFGFSEIIVGALIFDTSSIPDNAIITSAILRLAIEGKGTAQSRTLDLAYYDFAGTIDTGDFSSADSIGTTAGQVAAATWQAWALDSVQDIALSNPNANFNKLGETGIRMGMSGGQPPAGSNQDTLLSIYGFDHATQPAPELIVTYYVLTSLSLDANLSLAGNVARSKITPRALVGTTTLTSVLAFFKRRMRTVPATVTLTPVFARRQGRALAATLTATPVISLLAKKFRTVAAGLTLTPVINRRVGKLVAASLVVGQAMSFAKSKFLTLPATVTMGITVTRKQTLYKTIAAALSAVPVIARRQLLSKTLAANVTMTAQTQLIRTGRISLAGNLPLTGIVVKRGNRVLNSVVNFAGAIQIQKISGGAIQISLATGLQLQAGLLVANVIKRTITGALFLDSIIQRRKTTPADWEGSDWLIDAKSLDTPKLDGAQLDEAVLERTVL